MLLSLSRLNKPNIYTESVTIYQSDVNDLSKLGFPKLYKY